jgi:hypothetical protein
MTATTNGTAKVAARVAALIAQGQTAAQAIDAVCGAGTYDRLAGEVYDALRARAEGAL